MEANMTILDDVQTVTEGDVQSARLSMWMIEQMAEALEDQASGLSRRAAACEEEECLLANEIADRETEINRLLLKLESVRSERDGVLERIESLKNEATELREKVYIREEEAALAAIEDVRFEEELIMSHQPFRAPVTRPLNAP
jgi:chromosome segregation ATPase